MYTLVKRIVSDKEKAEEVLADIFVIIWKKSSMFDISCGNLYSWLINLTRNKSLDLLRRERAIVTDEYTDEYENKFILPQVSALISRDKIYSAFHNLTEAQQYVLSLAYYDGLSEPEIAKKLNIPLLTVKSKIRVVLNTLCDILAKEDER